MAGFAKRDGRGRGPQAFAEPVWYRTLAPEFQLANQGESALTGWTNGVQCGSWWSLVPVI